MAKCALNIPASIKPAFDGAFVYSCLSCPFRKGVSFAIVLNVAVCFCVAGLLNGSGPAAIFWAVAFAAILSVNGVRGAWPASHIIKKCLKVLPSLANIYSLCSIFFEAWIIRVLASLDHCIPVMKLREFGLSVSLPEVGNPPRSNTAARLGFPLPEPVSGDNGGFSAFADTRPSSLSAFRSMSSCNGKHSKILSSHVFARHNNPLYFTKCEVA